MKLRGMSTMILALSAVAALPGRTVAHGESAAHRSTSASSASSGAAAGAKTDRGLTRAELASLPLTDRHLTARERTNLAVVLREYHVAEADTLNVDAFINNFTEDGVLNDLVAGQTYRGEAMADLLNKMVRVFPDVHRELKSITVNGDTVNIELSIQGTFDGPMPTPEGELEPNGAKVDVPTADFWQLHDGKVQQFNCYLGYSSMFAQMGAPLA